MSLSFDRMAVAVLLIASLVFAGRAWLRDHPGHNPWAPLRLDDPPGWATPLKLAKLRANPAACRSFLDDSGIEFAALEPAGTGACRRKDRAWIASLAKDDVRLNPEPAEATCAIGAGLALWMRHGVQPRAEAIFGSGVARVEHLGTVNCRRVGGGDAGNWSEHATGNAIDIAGFMLEDGRRISVRGDWESRDTAKEDPAERGDKARFLRAVRTDACTAFSTVLSPEYNETHADHFHLDQARRTAGWRLCR